MLMQTRGVVMDYLCGSNIPGKGRALQAGQWCLLGALVLLGWVLWPVWTWVCGLGIITVICRAASGRGSWVVRVTPTLAWPELQATRQRR